MTDNKNIFNIFGLIIISMSLFFIFCGCLCRFTSPNSAERISRIQNEISNNSDAIVVDVAIPTELEIIQLELQDVEMELSTIEHLRKTLKNIEERLESISS